MGVSVYEIATGVLIIAAIVFFILCLTTDNFWLMFGMTLGCIVVAAIVYSCDEGGYIREFFNNRKNKALGYEPVIAPKTKLPIITEEAIADDLERLQGV